MVSIHYYFGTAHSSEFLDCAEEWSLSDKKKCIKLSDILTGIIMLMQ